MLALVQRTLFGLTRITGLVGMLFLLGAMGVTGIDVVLRKVSGGGIFGAVDIVQLMIVSAAFLSIPHAFMERAHVSVSLLTDRLSRRGTAACQLLASLLASIFMSAVAYHGYTQAMQQLEYGDVSMNLAIPMIYFWVPLLFGAALSTLVSLYIGAESLFSTLTGRSSVALDRGDA